MESSKSKSAKVLRKLTSPESRPQDLLYDLSNFRACLDPRKEPKPLAKTGAQRKSKAYLVNKTALGTPHEKSAMFSYISTPNEKSFTGERARVGRGEGKIREQFQSTEDEAFGEDCVRVTLLLGDRKTLSRHFSCGQRLALLA